MSTTTLLLNGFSVLNNPTTANTNASGGGELMIHDGEAAFESNDIIAIQVANVDENGILGNDSVVTGIIVYDNAYDYYNDIPKYTYTFNGNGDGADIPNGRSGMGDSYLRFDAEELTSTDSGAPVLGDLTMVSGVDLVSMIAAGLNPIKIDTYQDIDIDADGTIDPEEVADGAFSSQLNDLIAICFARGTLIETPDGPRFIETLSEGDLVITLDDGAQPIRWIGARKVSGRGQNAPIRIKAGALGNIRDLWVSPNHRMLVRGHRAELLFGEAEVLVAAKHLINDDTIRSIPCDTIEYHHFLMDAHQIVFAEACPAETLFPGKQSLATVPDDTRAEIVALFPEFANAEAPGTLSRYTLRAFEADALRRSA